MFVGLLTDGVRDLALLKERQDVQGDLSIPKPVLTLGKDFATGVAKPLVESVGSTLASEAANITSSIFKREGTSAS
jgi:hypothetical protein